MRRNYASSSWIHFYCSYTILELWWRFEKFYAECLRHGYDKFWRICFYHNRAFQKWGMGRFFVEKRLSAFGDIYILSWSIDLNLISTLYFHITLLCLLVDYKIFKIDRKWNLTLTLTNFVSLSINFLAILGDSWDICRFYHTGITLSI